MQEKHRTPPPEKEPKYKLITVTCSNHGVIYEKRNPTSDDEETVDHLVDHHLHIVNCRGSIAVQES